MKLVPHNYDKIDCIDLICNDLFRMGFSVIYNHGIRRVIIDDLFYEWEGWFQNYPISYKEKYIKDTKTQAGWFPVELSESAKGSDSQDLKEYFHYFKDGNCPNYCRPSTKKYFNIALDFSSNLLRQIISHLKNEYKTAFSSMPEADYLIEGCDSHLLRILHYPPVDINEKAGSVRASEHEDINLLTLLPASNARGLQLKLDNGAWEDVPIDGDYLIINAGDTLSLAGDYKIKSATHRVVNPHDIGEENISRISAPFFLHAKSSAVVHGDWTAGQILRERLRELGVL